MQSNGVFDFIDLIGIVLEAANNNQSKECYQLLLSTLWSFYQEHLIPYLIHKERGYEGTYRVLRELFVYADFPLPQWNQETVTVYRGTAGVSVESARDGLDWSLDRNYAASRAFELADLEKKPLVLRADVPVKSIIYYTDIFLGNEVLVIDGPWGELDGTEEDWEKAAERYNRSLFKKGRIFPKETEQFTLPL
jgi:hypothetical protein